MHRSLSRVARAVRLTLTATALLLAACSGKQPPTATQVASSPGGLPGDAARGAQIFAENCAVCHGSTGREGGSGPALAGEHRRKDTAAAIAWIKDPAPPMPKLYPMPLSEQDVADVAAYVEKL